MSLDKIDTTREVYIVGCKTSAQSMLGMPVIEPCGNGLTLTAAEGVDFLEDIRADKVALAQIEDTIQGLSCMEIDGVNHDLLTGWMDATTFKALAARHMIKHRGTSIATGMILLIGALEAEKAEQVDINWFEIAEDRRGRNANDK